MDTFWQLISDVGVYLALLCLILTIGFANSPRPLFQRYQFVWLIAAVILGIMSLYATDRMSGSGGRAREAERRDRPRPDTGRAAKGSGSPGSGVARTSTAAPPAPAAADIQPSFVDGTILHTISVPAFRKDDTFAVLSLYLPPGVMAKKKLAECYLLAKAETSLSSDRVTLTPQKLVFKRYVGTFAVMPFDGYVLDAADGKPGVKGRQEEVAVDPAPPEAVAAVAREAGVALPTGKGKKRGGLDAVSQVVRMGKLATVVIVQPLTLPQ